MCESACLFLPYSPECVEQEFSEVGMYGAAQCTVSLPWSERDEGRSDAMDQPTAGEALKRLEPLVGEWILEAKPPDGPPVAG